jgi:hypothetical protein
MHFSYIKQKLHFHHTLKNTKQNNSQWISQVCDYPLGLEKKFK